MSSLTEEFETISPDEFEQLVANIWEGNGWNTEVTSSSRDKGIDVVATRWTEEGKEKHLIQAKRYTGDNKVDSEEIRKYATLYQQEPDADKVLVVSTSGFTDPAEDLASDLDVDTVGPMKLKQKYRLSGLTAKEQETQTEQLESGFSKEIPEEEYHNDAWEKVKLAYKIPILVFGFYFFSALMRMGISGSLPDNLTYQTAPIVFLSAIAFLISLPIGIIIFIVYTPRDLNRIKEDDDATLSRIIIVTLITFGLYAIFYPIIRRIGFEPTE